MINDQCQFLNRLYQLFLDQDTVEQFIQQSEQQHYSREQIITKAGDDSRLVYLLESGQLSLNLFPIYSGAQSQTIKCLTDCRLRTIPFDQFTKFIKCRRLNQRKILEFLKSLPLLQQASFTQVTPTFSFIPVKKGKVVYKECDDAKFIAIIYDGEFQLTKKSQLRNLEVAKLSIGEIAGDIECINNKKFQYSLSCISPVGQIIIIKEQILHNMIDTQDPKIKKYLFDKLNNRTSRVLKIEQMKQIELGQISTQLPLCEIGNRVNSAQSRNRYKPQIEIDQNVRKKVLIKLGQWKPQPSQEQLNANTMLIKVSQNGRRRIHSNHC